MHGLTGNSAAYAHRRAIDLCGKLGVVQFGDADVRKAKLGFNVLSDDAFWDNAPAALRNIGCDGDRQRLSGETGGLTDVLRVRAAIHEEE
jgi:hypothetical protein